MKTTEAIRYLTPIRDSASLKHYREALTTAIDALEFRRRHEHPLTNSDRIRAMSDEELAVWMAECNAYKENADASQWLPWLQQPAKEGV